MANTFTNFCCLSGGSNLNSGTKTGDTTVPGTGATYTSTNGNWNGSTIFTPTDGSTPASSIAVGDFASIYLDAATVTVSVSRITAVAAGVNGAITVSAAARSGTVPTSGATGRTIKVGGAWKGPNAAEAFPFGFITAALVNVAGNPVRVNFKNDATYSMTAAMSDAINGVRVFQGFTSAYGDGGNAIIDGGTSGASYVLLTMSGNSGNTLGNLIFQNNGATGSATGVVISGARTSIRNCVFNSIVGHGLSVTGTLAIVDEVEVYSCNTSNTSALGGINQGGASNIYNRCILHDNSSGSNTHGMVISVGPALLTNCIFDTNAGNGILNVTNISLFVKNCDFYNQSVSGIHNNASISINLLIENCNFLKNTTSGITITTAALVTGAIRNCGFGTGTQANGTDISGDSNIFESNNISYASGITPWQNPANGDFRIVLPAAMNTGRGAFTQTQASYSGTVGYPDIGAAQHQEIPNRPVTFGVRSRRA